jgi:hypothetical protein
MSKYGWISGMTEHYLNQAVQERIKRWQVNLYSPILVRSTKNPSETRAQALERVRRAYKYRGSVYLAQAIWNFVHQNVNDLAGMRPRSLKGHVAMKKKAGDVKRFMKEVQRRYEVVDRAYGATIQRKGGRLDRVAK